jgi:DNA-binding CsgD family transcriptional regulator
MIPRALRRIADLIDYPCAVVGDVSGACYLNAQARARKAKGIGWPVGEMELIWVVVNGERFVLRVDHAVLQPNSEGIRAWQMRWGLSPRHARVAELAMQGMSDKQIADRTGLRFNTVRTYMQTILKAAGVSNRTKLLHTAVLLMTDTAEASTGSAAAEPPPVSSEDPV